MIHSAFSRRKWLRTGLVSTGALFLPKMLASNPDRTNPDSRFTYCLNTSTIRGQKLGIEKEIEVTAMAGYDGIEIWMDALQKYMDSGGNLGDLKMKVEDLGLKVENAIGFAKWIVDDHDVRLKALDQARKEMDWLAQIGCRRIAAPPSGATDQGGLDLYKAAERFRALVEIGDQMGVIPQLEIWGFSKNLFRLSQVLFVAAECGHPKVRILPDIYHLYKGGSDVDGLKLINGDAIEIFHMNDYPAKPNRDSIGDKDRVFPGDGVGPVTEVLTTLSAKKTYTVLSLELFNRTLWLQDPLEVARTGLKKMKEAVSTIPTK
jgi:sugar phosphate isomerase/epimerase